MGVRILASFLFFIIGTAAWASRECIVGLALGGGGARGAAHIGVLKVLEEAGVRVDCIAGTSMGAVIGGLYASGLTPDEIETALSEIDWADAFDDQPNRSDLPFRRKEDDRLYLLDRELGFKNWRFMAPRGLVAGQKLSFLLQSLTLHVSDLEDFDRLPIPFRAVAADILTGETVVLGTGNLAEAIRASMAYPGLFSPVEREGRTLVDGGIASNVPVDAVRAMGATVVIAVDVSSPPGGRDKIRSLFGVTKQVGDLMTRRNVDDEAPRADILLRPDLAGIYFLSFAKAVEAVRRGEASARARASDWAVLTDEAAPRRQRTAPPPVLDSIQFEGFQRVDPRRALARARTRPGLRLNLEVLREDLSKLYGIGEFETVEFRLRDEEGRTGLLVRAREKSWGPTYLRLGLDLTDDFEGGSYFNFRFNATRTGLNALGGEWRVDVQTGRTRRLFSELYQPITFDGAWFAAPGVEVRHSYRDLYEGDDRRGMLWTRLSLVGADLGLQVGRYGEARVGWRGGNLRSEVTSGALPIPKTDADLAGWVGRVVFDQLDDRAFPRNGGHAAVDLFSAEPSLGSDLEYDRLEGSLSLFRSFGKYTVFLEAEGGSALGTTLPLHAEFTLGGFHSLSGFADRQLAGQAYGVSRLGFRRRVGNLPGTLGRGVYLVGWAEAGNAWANPDSASLGGLLYAGTVGFGADTLLGPLYLGWGRAEGGHSRFYLSLGRSY